MWAQGNQWNQMSLDAASYQDVNHEHVDWASLAQQWIQMKEVHETVVLNVPSNHIMQLHPPPNSFPVDSGVVGGEAPMDVEKEDEHPPAPPTGLDWSWPPQQPQMPSWPRQFNPFAPRPPFLHGIAPAPPNISQNFIPGGMPHQFPRMPLLPMPLARQASSEDDSNLAFAGPQSMSALDAAKRKNLPAWIREGLEKMEREKQKKEEREKFLEEREQMRKMRLEEQQRNNPSSSRFDDNEDDSEPERVEQNDDQDEEEETERPSFSLKPAENLVDMVSVIRKLMTEILLEVTTEEIRSASFEVHQQSKVKSRPAPQSSLPPKSLTQKLGLDQYGSDSDSSDDDEGKPVKIETPKLDPKVLLDGKDEVKKEPADEALSNSGSGTVMVSNNTDSSGMICSTSGTKVEKSDNSNKIANGSKKEESSARKRSRSRSRRKSRSRSREKSRSSTKKRSRSRDRKRSRSRSRRSRSRSRSRRSSRRSRSRDRRSRRSRSRSKDRRKR